MPARMGTSANGFSSRDVNSTTCEEIRGSSPRRRCFTPFFIGVCGGTASGKTMVCDKIVQRLNDQCVVMLSLDSFFTDTLSEDQAADVSSINFDHPSAYDREAILFALLKLKDGKAVDVPVYDFVENRRKSQTRRLEPADVIIIKGLMVLHMEEIRNMLNMKIYVDTDLDVRLARRVQRDVQYRGRTVDSVIDQYTKFVKPAFDQYVEPSRRYADVIIPWQRGENLVAIDLITEHIRSKLQQHELRRIYPNLEVMPSNYQIRGLHTIIRDTSTSKSDFVFYADRLIRLVVETGLGLLPFQEKTVLTPTNHYYVGVDFARCICGVSIIRSGESMEAALRACCKGVKIGKLLVENRQNQERLIYKKLPSDIAKRHVLLMDPILSTGNATTAAIQVLLGEGVPEEQIILLTIMAAPEGINKICGTYPGVKVVTSEIDSHVSKGQVVPGVGQFGDRYFCT